MQPTVNCFQPPPRYCRTTAAPPVPRAVLFTRRWLSCQAMCNEAENCTLLDSWQIVIRIWASLIAVTVQCVCVCHLYVWIEYRLLLLLLFISIKYAKIMTTLMYLLDSPIKIYSPLDWNTRKSLFHPSPIRSAHTSRTHILLIMSTLQSISYISWSCSHIRHTWRRRNLQDETRTDSFGRFCSRFFTTTPPSGTLI